MERSQHTAQSKQPASEKILSTRTLVHHFASGPHWSPMQHPPWEREGFSKTDSTQYCNSRNTQNQEEAQLPAAWSMHQILPNGSIKGYLRHTNVNKEHKLKTSKVKHPEGWRKKKHRSERKLYYSKSSTLYFAFMNIVLEFYKLITALPKFQIESALRAGLSSHIVSIPT